MTLINLTNFLIVFLFTTYFKINILDYWIPILIKLSKYIPDTSRPKLQLKSLQTFNSLLLNFGNNFEHDYWKVIFSLVLKPLFDDMGFIV